MNSKPLLLVKHLLLLHLHQLQRKNQLRLLLLVKLLLLLHLHQLQRKNQLRLLLLVKHLLQLHLPLHLLLLLVKHQLHLHQHLLPVKLQHHLLLKPQLPPLQSPSPSLLQSLRHQKPLNVQSLIATNVIRMTLRNVKHVNHPSLSTLKTTNVI